MYHPLFYFFLISWTCRYVPESLWPEDKYYPYASGHGILSSIAAVRAMSGEMSNSIYNPNEDVYFGILAHEAKIQLTAIGNPYIFDLSDFKESSGYLNIFLVSRCSEDSMQKLDRKLPDPVMKSLFQVDEEVKILLQLALGPAFVGKYLGTFETYGYDSIRALTYLNKDHMELMGIAPEFHNSLLLTIEYLLRRQEL
jgi:hypothetical protein